jgi:hypothetical protein
MIEDHSRMEERVEELMKMVKEAAGTEGDSDEEEDDDDVEIVRQLHARDFGADRKANLAGQRRHVLIEHITSTDLMFRFPLYTIEWKASTVTRFVFTPSFHCRRISHSEMHLPAPCEGRVLGRKQFVKREVSELIRVLQSSWVGYRCTYCSYYLNTNCERQKISSSNNRVTVF